MEWKMSENKYNVIKIVNLWSWTPFWDKLNVAKIAIKNLKIWSTRTFTWEHEKND